MVRSNTVRKIALSCALGASLALGAVGAAVAETLTSDAWADSDCLECHASFAESPSLGTHAVLPCVTCHDDADTLAEHHDGVDETSRVAKRLKYTEVTPTACLSCHGDGGMAAPTVEGASSDEAGATASDQAAETPADADEKATAAEKTTDSSADADATKTTDGAGDADDAEAAEELPPHEALILATADCTVLTDEEGRVVNPHDLPATAEHQAIVCVDCHKGHTTKDLAETALATCTICHHENVFACYTCHE